MPPKPTGKSRRLVLGAVVVLALAVGVGVLVAPRNDRPSAREVEALQEALRGPTQHWGRLEIQGMRAAVADLQAPEGVPDELIGGEARAWQSSLSDIAGRIEGIRTSDDLRPIVTAFRRAVDPYLDAARLFEQATTVTGAERTALIERGAAAAQQGAVLYNEASMQLQAARRRAGLPPTTDFPDHPAES
ncbi:MAG TPA: hypothetical protein VM938_01890 [Acidimicrobiales bacterium]|nr:hypothetical protein [Acidimicrobiales bacterium]